MEDCMFCHEPANPDNPDTYHEVTEFVHGEKKHGAVLRDYTGRIAHKDCVDKLKQGQAVDQPPLF